ncbi:MAG: hypothetical protein IPH32_18735 [Bacteroidetes bacterium]|nr:hypothetical protein [Bacteroidota bacterium]
MKKNSVIIFLIGLGINYLNAQYLILKRDGTNIQAKILEVGINDIKYKRFDYITGPTITLIKSSIFYIKYENGTKEVFAKEEKPNLGNNITNNPPPPKDLNLPATILKRDGEEIKATLLEINETTIKIFPSNKSKEATVNLHKSAIFI